MVDYKKENYKTYFEIWNENSKLHSERENNETSQPTLDSILVGANISDVKTPATKSSARKEKERRLYAPEDPDSDPNSSDSLSIDSDSSGNSIYKRKKIDKKKNHRKHKNQDPIKLCAKLTAKLLTTVYK